jgi:hypothetical protein
MGNLAADGLGFLGFLTGLRQADVPYQILISSIYFY